MKVLHVKDPVQVTGGKTKQDVIVGDPMATTNVTLWEQYIGTMSPSHSYCLQDFVVKEFNMNKFLSMPKEGASISPIADIGEVQQAADMSVSDPCITNAQIRRSTAPLL